jgi:hypothetical protein
LNGFLLRPVSEVINLFLLFPLDLLVVLRRELVEVDTTGGGADEGGRVDEGVDGGANEKGRVEGDDASTLGCAEVFLA